MMRVPEMQAIHCCDHVRFDEELGELDLHRGDVGIVQRSWHYPTTAYEVEFFSQGHPLRVLLMDHQVLPTR